MLIVGAEDGGITFLDTRGTTLRAPLLYLDGIHKNMVTDVTLRSDDALLISASSDGFCKCIDTAVGRVTAVFDCQGSVGPLRQVRMSRDVNEHLVFAAGRSSAVAVFDIRTRSSPVALVSAPPASTRSTISSSKPAGLPVPLDGHGFAQPASEPEAASASSSSVTLPSDLLCLSCINRAPLTGRLPLAVARTGTTDRLGGLATMDHYLITGSAAGEVHLWDTRRCVVRGNRSILLSLLILSCARVFSVPLHSPRHIHLPSRPHVGFQGNTAVARQLLAPAHIFPVRLPVA